MYLADAVEYHCFADGPHGIDARALPPLPNEQGIGRFLGLIRAVCPNSMCAVVAQCQLVEDAMRQFVTPPPPVQP